MEKVRREKERGLVGPCRPIERSQHPAYTMATASGGTPILGKASYACVHSLSNLSRPCEVGKHSRYC